MIKYAIIYLKIGVIKLDNKYIAFFFIWLSVILILLLLYILTLEIGDKKTSYYGKKIKYNFDLDKHISMLKRQRFVIIKKEIELYLLKMYSKLRGV